MWGMCDQSSRCAQRDLSIKERVWSLASDVLTWRKEGSKHLVGNMVLGKGMKSQMGLLSYSYTNQSNVVGEAVTGCRISVMNEEARSIF